MNNENVKRTMKKSRWIYDLNAAIKSRQVRKEYDRVAGLYAGKTEKGTAEQLLARRSGERLERFRNVRRPLRIFYMGTDELQDRAGILQGLEQVGEVTYFEQADGKYGQYLSGTRADRQIKNSERLLQMFETLHVDGRTPDILFGQMQGRYVFGRTLDEIRNRYGTLVANVNMDDRHQFFGTKENGAWGGTYELVSHTDLALTAAPECVSWYLKEGCPAVFFPEASDPKIFRPMPGLPKLHDVSFIGGRYGIRDKVVSALRKAGIQVTAYGTGWEAGRLANDEVPLVFAQSKIILGIGTIGHSPDFYTLKIRDFDATMAGSCYLTHPNPDLSLLFEVGKELVTYVDSDDCVAKVKYYLERDEEREAIAIAGRLRCEREHTWAGRFAKVIDWLRSVACDLPEVSVAPETLDRLN
jgi:spore maturation protein CgeB